MNNAFPLSLFHFHRISKKWFTLVELVIGMTIFAIGMTWILALLQNTISLSLISRHEVIAANLLREQSELLKNMRNINIRSFVDWDRARIDNDSLSFTGGTFMVENDFSNNHTIFDSDGKIMTSPIFMRKIDSFPPDLEGRFHTSQLFLDTKGRYTHESSPNPTNYASYTIISPLQFDTNGTTIKPKDHITGKIQGYILDARIIVKSRGYQEYDLKTLITDWKK